MPGQRTSADMSCCRKRDGYTRNGGLLNPTPVRIAGLKASTWNSRQEMPLSRAVLRTLLEFTSRGMAAAHYDSSAHGVE